MALTIQLPLAIKSREEAVAYLTMLHETGYAYHPDDPVYDGTPEGGVIWSLKPKDEWPNEEEQHHMDELMEQVFEYEDDPCAILCDLDNPRVPVVAVFSFGFKYDLYDESMKCVESGFDSIEDTKS